MSQTNRHIAPELTIRVCIPFLLSAHVRVFSPKPVLGGVFRNWDTIYQGSSIWIRLGLDTARVESLLGVL